NPLGSCLTPVFGGEEVADYSQVIEKMERETGVEPATSSLGSWHSTTELLPPLNRTGAVSNNIPRTISLISPQSLRPPAADHSTPAPPPGRRSEPAYSVAPWSRNRSNTRRSNPRNPSYSRSSDRPTGTQSS